MFSERSGNGVKGQHAGCVSIRAALDEMTRITLSDGKGQHVPFLLPGEGGSGQRPAFNERLNEKQGRSCPCFI